MTKRLPRSKPTWTDIKAKLAGLDRLGLVGLIQDLYIAQKDNQTFLHTRFGLGNDVLKPYKETLNRWLSPDVLRNQDISVAKAKKAISDYRKAIGEPAGLAELMVLYCENAVGFPTMSATRTETTLMLWPKCSKGLLSSHPSCLQATETS